MLITTDSWIGQLSTIKSSRGLKWLPEEEGGPLKLQIDQQIICYYKQLKDHMQVTVNIAVFLCLPQSSTNRPFLILIVSKLLGGKSN